ncbi:uncharacterized protein BcabD6B2_34380 [Babesia caballi]|uniref:Uncharacterized protein n=1 Tax=Babesia caballi TaxID=5871 RepID=A0AAV4LV05_BABCB|nr:hypothetical protein BcabD6B2_34380 [Babesia caballi]
MLVKNSFPISHRSCSCDAPEEEGCPAGAVSALVKLDNRLLKQSVLIPVPKSGAVRAGSATAWVGCEGSTAPAVEEGDDAAAPSSGLTAFESEDLRLLPLRGAPSPLLDLFSPVRLDVDFVSAILTPRLLG